ncbi:Imm63 family immunity protein [Marinifilum caeruleilacunae]|uniref:Immunity protein 63 domain-containing protein n=1 Tax=Marinifilum caeruleilacunae TaxID=2499076 RepID=A0ABX1WUL3_9BACT|nr:Imm63 family immunity protein [Marinifilum caeruleilacunae]NOU59630.1 hypothetical protein [Marinifilum caeruleilacunae]
MSFNIRQLFKKRKQVKPTMSYRFIKGLIEKFASRINAPVNLLPTYEHSEDFARPHIEIDVDNNLHFVVIERGKEIERRKTAELEELIYWVFEGITLTMAFDYEVKNRKQNQDPRIIAFNKQLELLNTIDSKLGHKCKQKQEKILLDAPYSDINDKKL